MLKLGMAGKTLCVAVSLLMIAGTLPCSVGGETRNRVPVREKGVRSYEQDPRAIVKEGFFRGIESGRVTLQDMGTYREASYRLEEDCRLLFEDAEIELNYISPDSIVKLIMIEGQIREIILLQRSS